MERNVGRRPESAFSVDRRRRRSYVYTASSLLIWVIERARRRRSMIVTGDSGRSCCRRSLRPESTARVRAYGPTWLAKSRRELATTRKQITAVDSFSSTFTSFHAVAAPPAESLVRTAGTELNRTPDTCIPVKGSRRTNWLSTSRPSFAAANPVVRLKRVTNERVVQLGWLAAGQFSSFLVLWNKPSVDRDTIQYDTRCYFNVRSKVKNWRKSA